MKIIGLGGRAYDESQTESLGFLLVGGGNRLLVECGPYTVQKLRSQQDMAVSDLTHVFVSHDHADHAGGLPALVHAALFDSYFDFAAPAHIEMLVPQMPGCRCIETLRSSYPDAIITEEDPFADGEPQLRLRQLMTARRTKVGNKFEVVVIPGDHTVPSASLCVELAGTRLVYLADSRASIGSELRNRGVQAEAVVACVSGSTAASGDWCDQYGFMTAAESARIATEIQAGHLILMHVFAEDDWTASIEEARDGFAGEVHALTGNLAMELS